MDAPKSPCSMLPKYLTSWTGRGLSKPYLAFRASITWGEGVFSDSQGLPGIACITKKVIHATTRMVTIAIKTRFTTYFAISSLPITIVQFP